MTNQIAKDPGVINAVSNTAKYKKDTATKEKLELEGKWAPSNEAAFQKDVQRWYSNPSIDSKYSANVSPYVNVQEDSQKIIKGLAQDITSNEVMFDYAPDGKTIISVRDVMTKQVIKELTPEKIQTALKSGLSPQAWRQLSIDGEYKYSNTTTDDFINQINSGYKKRFTFLNEKRSEFENMLTEVQTPAQRLQIQNSIDAQDAMIASNKREYDSLSSSFEEGNVDSSKAQFYTMKWMENISQSFSSREIETDSKVTPYFTVRMQKNNRALALAKFEEQKKNNRIMQGLKQEEVDLLKEPKTGLSIPIPGQDTTPANIISNDIIKTDGLIKSAYAERGRVAELMNWDDTLRFVDINNDGIFNEGDIEAGEGYVSPEGTKALTEFDRLLSTAISNNFNTVSPSSLSDVQGYIIKQRDADSATFKNKVISGEVDKQLPIDLSNLVPEEYKNTTWGGFNPEQTAILINSFDEFAKTTAVGTISGSGIVKKYDDQMARNALTDQEFKLYTDWRASDGTLAYEMRMSINKQVKEITTARNLLESELLVKATPQEQDVSVGLNISNKEVKNTVQNILGTIENVANGRGGWPGLTEDEAKDIVAIKDGIVDVSMYTGVQELRVSGAGFNKTIPLTDETYEILSKGLDIQVNSTPEVSSFNRSYLPQLLSTNPSINNKDFFTTAFPNEFGKSTRQTSQENAYLKQSDFPSIRYLRNVSGNLISKVNPRNNDPQLYLQVNFDYLDPKEQTSSSAVPHKIINFEIPFDRGLNKAEMITFMNSLTDDALFRAFTQRDMSLEEKKLLQNQPLNLPE
jgi:hypothetical protein